MSWKIFLGNIVTSSKINELNAFSGYVVVKDGQINGVGKLVDLEQKYKDFDTECEVIHLLPHQFLMPGFVDCHTHAPQFPNIGLGLDLPLLQWLDKYTFPLEKKYEDTQFAAQVYDKVVRRLLDNGTTTACYFGSLHSEGTVELAKSALKHKQRAFIGKVSMDVKNDTGYYNNTQDELIQVKMFIEKIKSFQNDLVKPIITPRFALSCGGELMKGLAELAHQYMCPIQTHVSENQKEIEAVLAMFPDCSSYSEVYDRCDILKHRCILAHGVWLSDAELALLVSRRAAVAHCPASNTRLRSGLCPVRRLLDHGVTVGLGTDVSGGDSASILDAMRRAMDVSTHLEMLTAGERALDWREVFYLATRGGAEALSMDSNGSFESSFDFDALVVDVYTDGQVDKFDYPPASGEEYILQLLQKFIYVGDDRNIVHVYVKGEKVKDVNHLEKKVATLQSVIKNLTGR
ncbi:guanine deaminase [Aricia agestis]|uniref:guanine deaminase n=1 Tax=Aricia agestis TaxID=91739 RepID=UPI001C205C8F|nr:guanine deaminase [Aricia agestis]